MGDDARQLCARLQNQALEHVRADRRRASVLVARLLDMIERRLFDVELDVAALLRWCDQRDKNVLTRFAAELGLPPGAYITVARMRLGARLLAETTLKVWEVAAEVGYTSASSFGRAFKKWSKGQSPVAFRKAADSPARDPQPPPLDDMVSRRQIRRALDGDLPPETAEALSDQLYGLGDLVRSNYQELGPPPPGSGAGESVMARNLWQWIESLPFEVQLNAVESQAPIYQTPVLFHRLCTVSLEAEDGVRALRRSSLALACLPALAKCLGEKCLNIFARAWAIAGAAQRRVGNLEQAAWCFHAASETLEQAADEAHPVVVAELCLYQAMLEIEHDNFALADELTGRGTSILELLVERLLEQPPGDES